MKIRFAHPDSLASPNQRFGWISGLLALAACVLPGTVFAIQNIQEPQSSGSTQQLGNSTPVFSAQDQTNSSGKIIKTDRQWREQLTDQEYYVTRKQGTELAYSGMYWNQKKDGIYTCKCCGQQLFDSTTKYNSGTGWPSYYQPLKKEVVTNIVDNSGGARRIEVTCSRCDAHLGHVFRDGPQPTGLRYCMNSISLNFVPASELPEKIKTPIEIVEPGFESPNALAEALKIAVNENSSKKYLQCACLERLPEVAMKRLEATDFFTLRNQVSDVTVSPSKGISPDVEGHEYNVNYVGNIQLKFSNDARPLVFPYGVFDGRYYLAVMVEKGSIPSDPELKAAPLSK